ncbi:glycoside hydrolase family 127 protein [Rugosimonospora acidiphila]|uniref:Glycoside hydrolase family 127 protein n=1 Tax=Rugosimonospora acidiphila TaxID=556531 RepID=A0ABP9SQ23_9ACTN
MNDGHNATQPDGVTTARLTVAPVAPGTATLLPLGIDKIRISGGFWGHRQQLNRDAIIPHIARWQERVGWTANFDAVANGTVGHTRSGREFSDSEVYKLLEAMSWEIARTGDEELEQRLQSIVERIASAQQPDGYLNTRFGNADQPSRYSDLEWGHELYCYGHLIQAAVARIRSGHHDRLVEIACKAADHVCDTFGPDGLAGVCGHPEIETALVELYRATGVRRYLRQARVFLDRRGRHSLQDIEFGRSYFQDDIPIADAQVLRGHAVRALYLSAGAVDAAVEADDSPTVEAVERQYQRTLQRRTYLTGGMGSHHQDEAFGDDFELPPDRAYCETCAGVASIMVAWRLLLTTGNLAYADTIERTLYNVVAASPSTEGTAFFYTNPLHQRVAGQPSDPDEVSPRAHAQLRAPWFEVACCPPNVARTLAQLATYVATTNRDGVQLLQYAPGTIHASLEDGQDVRLDVSTRYPDDGEVTVTVVAAPRDRWTLTLRIPSWADGATVEVDGQVSRAQAPSHTVHDAAADSRIVLRLPMEPRWTTADPRIDAVRGTVAVERGPLVLCAESVDLPGGADVQALRIDPKQPPRPVGDGAVAAGVLFVPNGGIEQPYGRLDAYIEDAYDIELPLVPYHRWANRGPSTMRVWIPTR